MLITGKILEENLMFTSTKKISASNGKRRILFKPMQMAVNKNTGANILMDGKNRNTTLLIIRCMRAGSRISVKNLIAHIFTLTKIEDRLLVNISKSFQKIEVQLFNRHSSTKESF
jgi:hypothetical protein